MASLDLLERMLLKIISETETVRLKRQRIQAHKQTDTEEEQRLRIGLLLRRLDKLPEEKRREVLDLLKWFNW